MRLVVCCLLIFAQSCSSDSGKVVFVRANDTGCLLLDANVSQDERLRAYLRREHMQLWEQKEFSWEILGPLRCADGKVSYFGRSRPRHVGMHFFVKIKADGFELVPGL